MMRKLRVAGLLSALVLLAGDGYFTQLLTAVVGLTGHVVAHNNKAYLDGVGETLAHRFEGPQALVNAERVAAEGNELELTPGSFDAVLLSAVYHDIYYVNEPRNWPKIDGPRLLAELFEGMKPGATLVVIHHAAPAGLAGRNGRRVAPHRSRDRQTRFRRGWLRARRGQ